MIETLAMAVYTRDCVRDKRGCSMKLRITPNSIRLRLNQDEVAQFVRRGELSERVEFPAPESSSLLYRLRFSVGPDSTSPSVEFANDELAVQVPSQQAKEWASRPGEVGIYSKYELDGGKSFRVMIEKDFQCIDGPSSEIDPAGYPHPSAKIGCKTESKL
jgi:hypothetical protein